MMNVVEPIEHDFMHPPPLQPLSFEYRGEGSRRGSEPKLRDRRLIEMQPAKEHRLLSENHAQQHAQGTPMCDDHQSTLVGCVSVQGLLKTGADPARKLR